MLFHKLIVFCIWFNVISYNSLCFLTIVCNIIPQLIISKDIVANTPEIINVGNLGTKPVSINSMNIGTNIIKAIIIKNKDIAEKKKNGL